VLDNLPEPPPIFSLIQPLGQVPDAEMFTTFNMGVGFCLVVSLEDADRAVEILRANGERAQVIGTIGELGRREVLIPQRGLTLSPSGA